MWNGVRLEGSHGDIARDDAQGTGPVARPWRDEASLFGEVCDSWATVRRHQRFVVGSILRPCSERPSLSGVTATEIENGVRPNTL